MADVLRRRVGTAFVAALGLAVAAATAVIAVAALTPASASADTLSATVSATPTGAAMPSGFVGVSFEYRAMHQYTGRDPRAINPVLLSLLKGLAPDQSPIIRVGGNSTDDTWWPIRGMIPQGGIYYRLTKGWLRTTQALAADLDAKLILGINLASGRSAIAAAEGRAFVQGIGRKYIDALEIGNEPDLFPVFAWYKDRNGHVYRRRSGKYSLKDYIKQFTQWSKVLPNLPLAGPAVSGPNWMKQLGSFIKAEPRAKLITYHRYPLRACDTNTSDPMFASIPNLLADDSSAGLAAGFSPFVKVATQHRLPFRIAEMNTASCEGAKGVSDTFASALWSLDTMFNFAAQGVQGVNFHMLPGSNYELFTVSQAAGGAWQAFVHPEYYGLMMFAQAFPPDARLLPVSAPAGPVKDWATVGTDGTVRITLINQDATAEHDVNVSIPSSTGVGDAETLTAPGLTATSGVELGGQSFGDETATGTLPTAPATTPVTPAAGVYTVPLAPGSATLLTIPGPSNPGGGIGLNRR